MNLVVGATGNLGTEICRQLAERHEPVTAMVRSSSDPDRVDTLRSLGVKLRIGDLKQPPSLVSACAGVSRVISTASSTISRAVGDDIDSVDDRGQRNLIDAARAAGVRHFVYVSVSKNVVIDSPLLAAKRGTEAYLIASGMSYTILRPSCFMEVWLSPFLGFDIANARARVYGSGDTITSWVSMRDVAAFAIASLTAPKAKNATIDIGGPDALTQRETIRLFEQAAGRPIEREVIPEEALRQQYEASTESMERTFAALMLSIARGDHINMDDALERIPMHLTSLDEYARRLVAH